MPRLRRCRGSVELPTAGRLRKVTRRAANSSRQLEPSSRAGALGCVVLSRSYDTPAIPHNMDVNGLDVSDESKTIHETTCVTIWCECSARQLTPEHFVCQWCPR